MKTMLLINLPIKTQFQKFVEDEIEYNPSLGLLAIASFLNMHGYKVIVKDFNYEMYSLDLIIDIIEKFEPLLVGITAYTENVKEVIRLSRQIKKLSPQTNIIAGGPHATLRPEDLIKSRYIDFVSMKEGESVFLELIQYLENPDKENGIQLDWIHGLVYRKNGIVIKNPQKKYITKLDLLPIMNRNLMEMPHYSGTVNVSTSRGCPANCIYCAATALSGACYRVRDIKNVFQEILWIEQYYGKQIERYYFVDDTFTVDVDRVYAFISLRKNIDGNWKWACESRVDVMTESLLDEMYENGCDSIQFGVESGNQKVLDKIHKKIELSQVWKMVSYAAQYDMEICLSFMFGHYCDTLDTMEDTVQFMKDIKAINANVKFGIGYNTPLPGTWQYTRADEIGLKILTTDYSKYDLITPIIETEAFTTKDLEDMYYHANKIIGN